MQFLGVSVQYLYHTNTDYQSAVRILTSENTKHSYQYLTWWHFASTPADRYAVFHDPLIDQTQVTPAQPLIYPAMRRPSTMTSHTTRWGA